MNTKSVIENYFKIISGAKEGNFIDCLAQDATWNLPPHHPFGSVFSGMDNILQMLGRGMPMFEAGSLKFDIHAIVCEDENAFAHFTMTGKTGKGADYSNQYLFRFRVREGKITEIWESMDTQYMHELGMYEGI